jgi:uncharacterized membrane protein
MILFALIVLVVIISGAYLKKEYFVVRDIVINKPKQEVYDYIKILRNQNHYSYYNRKDPNTVKSYSGTDAEVGFTYSWSSKITSIGTGTQTITKLTEGTEIRCDIQFTKPLPLKSTASIALTEVSENETKVTWTFGSVYNFPLNVIIYFVNLEKLIGTDLASSLVTLKEKLDK